MRHVLIVAFLVILLTLLVYFGLNALGLLPEQAAAQAEPIDWLLNLELIVISFLFALIVVPLVYSLVAFRRRPGETGDGQHIEGHTGLEIGWTVIPLIVVLIFAYLGAENLAQVRRVDPQAMQVQVTGFQWGWQFKYPEYGIRSQELYLPVDEQILFKMESTDVIHSFWVPEFRVKQDLVPGRVTEVRVTPSKVGSYTLMCAELCGTQHAYMNAPVIVVSRADFDAWVAERQIEAAAAAASGPDADRGEEKYLAYCKACHSVDGSKGVGPTWRGLYEIERPLSDGTKVVADEAYLLQSILDPGSQVVEGFAPMVFNAEAVGLTDADLADIVEFIKTLK
jgi:cytochrome c oxidase subunit 2